MTDEEFLEKLRTVANGTISGLKDNPDQVVELRAGRMRLTITRDGVFKERLVPRLTLYTNQEIPSPDSRGRSTRTSSPPQ